MATIAYASRVLMPQQEQQELEIRPCDGVFPIRHKLNISHLSRHLVTLTINLVTLTMNLVTDISQIWSDRQFIWSQ